MVGSVFISPTKVVEGWRRRARKRAATWEDVVKMSEGVGWSSCLPTGALGCTGSELAIVSVLFYNAST